MPHLQLMSDHITLPKQSSTCSLHSISHAGCADTWLRWEGSAVCLLCYHSKENTAMAELLWSCQHLSSFPCTFAAKQTGLNNSWNTSRALTCTSNSPRGGLKTFHTSAIANEWELGFSGNVLEGTLNQLPRYESLMLLHFIKHQGNSVPKPQRASNYLL